MQKILRTQFYNSIFVISTPIQIFVFFNLIFSKKCYFSCTHLEPNLPNSISDGWKLSDYNFKVKLQQYCKIGLFSLQTKCVQEIPPNPNYAFSSVTYFKESIRTLHLGSILNNQINFNDFTIVICKLLGMHNTNRTENIFA